MNLKELANKVLKEVKSNSPELLTAIGVSGVVTTSFLTAKASFKAARCLGEESPYLSVKEKGKIVWKLFIPPAVAGTVTVGCVIGASKTSAKRTAAAVTAYSLTERAFSEYKEKVIEQIGKGKEQKIRDELAQKNVDGNPVGSKEVVVIGSGQVLCCELLTKRYFRSDMETLRKAQNDINAMLNSGVYVTLEEFYDIIGLSNTSQSDHLGWESDKQMNLDFSTVLSDAKEPCLAFDYNYVRPIR